MIAIALGLLGTACVQIDGGAVELAWGLRDFGGDQNDCASSGVSQVRVCWVGVGEADAGVGPTDCVTVAVDGGIRAQYRDFECIASRGVTRFEVDPGPTAIFIRPLCGDGAVATGPYQVPPPIVRTVEQGKVVTLNQLQIVATKQDACGPDADLLCTCSP